jgi:single-strand DNA-binding protein
MARIEITGTLGKDPELKFVQGKNGEFAVAEFSIADSQSENKNGEWVDGVTVWYRVSVLGRQAETVTDTLTKGTRVKVVGTFKVSEYTAKDGTLKQSFDIKADEITLPLKAQKAKKDEGSAWS